MTTKADIESLLTDCLPASVSDYQYFFYNPGTDLLPFTAYLKFNGTLDEFENYVDALELRTAQQEISPHLPTAWTLPRELEIEWWDAIEETPANAAAKSIQNNGWIVAKHEGNTAYVIISGQL